jgi:hypothetical protein
MPKLQQLFKAHLDRLVTDGDSLLLSGLRMSRA